MANFAPSIYFARRWLATPTAVKRAFYEELDDIITLLDGDTPAQEFPFNHADFDDTIATLLLTEQSNVSTNKLVHSFDVSALNTAEHAVQLSGHDIEILEKQLNEKLSSQINDFLDEHFTQLSNDLYTWLQTTIKNELAAYKRQDTLS